MTGTKVVDELVDVRFYTALDPYYYVVDNRPLEDLNENILLIAEATDASSGSANRAALGVSSTAYSILGFGGTTLPTGQPVNNSGYFVDRGLYAGRFDLSGLDIIFGHGYASIKTDGGIVDGNQYDLPATAVHDKNKRFTLTPGTNGTTYLVQGSWRASTTEDRVASGDSPVLVLELSVKSTPGVGPTISPPLLDAGHIAIMRVDVPTGATSLLPSYITYLNLRDIAQTSNPLDNATISYNSYQTVLNSGEQNIGLNSTDIDPSKIESVEVFVQGINQFNWTYDNVNNQITLQSPLTENAAVYVRQTKISLF